MRPPNTNLACVPAVLAVLVFGTFASNHNPGLVFQHGESMLDYTEYIPAPKKPNVLFIITDDQGD